ncbi:MAG TPA: glycoside hydrolase family 95 protein, partial [Candidatus Pelethocola excrementipullorum]|nr:glycoside hydrolase family 95 protein [Candidatus Pelethocola excrementipullorum]
METLSVYLKKPARKWEEGLPLGNGRLGAMVMGRVKEETVLINDETLCYGPPRERENPDGSQELQNIRNLLLEGKVEDASFLARMALTSTPKYNNPYQPIGELRLCFQGGRGRTENYERRLDIEHAVVRVSFELDGSRYIREYFVSKAYQVLAIRVRVEGEGDITMSANIGRKPFEEFTGTLDE